MGRSWVGGPDEINYIPQIHVHLELALANTTQTAIFQGVVYLKYQVYIPSPSF